MKEKHDKGCYQGGGPVDDDPANGTTHVVLNRPEFYTLETSGVRFADWLGDLANGRSVEGVSPGEALPSALGDSPTVTGTIANLGRGDFAGRALEIRMGRFTSDPGDVYAQAPISERGSFSIELPGEADVASYLFDARPTLFGPGPDECDLSISPAAYKTLGTPDFGLYSDAQPVDRLLHTVDPNSNYVFYVYVDRDVTITGPCTEGMSAGFSFDIDMRKGWNTVVVDFAVLEFRSERPGSSYKWLAPSLCAIGSDCSPDSGSKTY